MRLDNYSVICSFDTVSIRAANMAIDISKNRNGGFMLASLSLIFIVGLAMGAICQKLKLPRIIGMLVTGIVLGPYVLDAVSPAVVVPRMVTLMEKKYGTEKAIPQMIIAGASCDDIFVIVLFTTFLSIAQGGHANVRDFVNIPVSIVLGVILGAVTGYGLYLFFETAYARKHCVRNSMKVIIVLGFSFLLSAVGGWLEEKIPISGLLAVVAMACVIAYLPKATVQAAIGSVPLAAGLACGKIVLSVAVLAIIITAPLGAIGMDAAYQRLLEKEN